MTLGQLLEEMTSTEFELWIALYKIENLEETERQVRAKVQAKGAARRG